MLVGSKKEQTLKKMLLNSKLASEIFVSPKKNSFTKSSHSAQKCLENHQDSSKKSGNLGRSAQKKFIPFSENSEKEQIDHSDIEKEFMFISASFDGALNLWSSADTKGPIFTTQGKNFMDASPYGGLEIFKNNEMNLLQIVSSGNKEDPTLNVWILK